MKNKNSIVIFSHCISYMFKTILKTFRTYIYFLIMPVILLSLVYFLTSQSIIKYNRYIIVSSYILLPILFNIFLIGHLICQWRESVFLKQLHNFGINKIAFILSLLIVIFVISFCTVFILLGYLFFLDQLQGTNIMTVWILAMKTFSQWFGLIFSISLNIIVIFFLALLISGSIKNPYIIQTINIIIFLTSILFGDFFIDMTYTISTPTIIIGYFVPQKYITWINFIFYSQSDKNYYNFFQIVPSVDYKLSFTNIYQPVFSCLTFIGLFAVGSYFSFLHGTRK
ncbi:hypothetical protein [Spiroplasma endosymbiont of Andrena trimmerana]|uniref:hypothetical protein n=2 Tax=Spiroplasma TaxID=2132 RepID=UPI0030D1D061